MTAGSFAFGWALVPLYDVLCRVAGIGNAEAKAGSRDVREAVDPNREMTIEFVADPASVGSFDFRPEGRLDAHPSRQALRHRVLSRRNLTTAASVAQAVPSISPSGAAKYFHKTECFCFSPQKFRGRRRPRHAGALHRRPAIAGQRRQAHLGVHVLRHDASRSAPVSAAG